MSKQEHSHPIALKGSRVAKTKYDVLAYPTTFWLDREGKLVSRHVGFDGPEQLEAELKKLLGEEE